MKKRTLFLSAACVLAGLTIAVSTIVSGNFQWYNGVKASDDFYSIVFAGNEITTSSENTSGTVTLKTHELQNDIALKFVECCYIDDTLYLEQNAAGYIYNDIGSEIRGMNSITIKGASCPFTVYWGFENEGSINISTVNGIGHTLAVQNSPLVMTNQTSSKLKAVPLIWMED